MTNVMLTLRYLKVLKGIPVATTTDLGVLRHIKWAVLKEWQEWTESLEDNAGAVRNRFEYQCLHDTLSILIPDDLHGGYSAY